MKSIKKILSIVVLGLTVFLYQNCTPFEEAQLGSSSSQVSFYLGLQSNLIEPKCLECHSTVLTSGGVNLSTYAAMMASGTVTAGNASTSSLYTTVYNPTLQAHNILTPFELEGLATWINNGARENEIPEVSAGPDLTIKLPLNSTQVVGQASDLDGQIVSYLWEQISGPNNSNLNNATSRILTASNLVDGVYTFRLTATDNFGDTSTDSMTVTVSLADNILPLVEAGPSQSITLPIATVSMTATASDSDGTITNIIWTQSAGPSSATLAGQTTLSLTVSNLIAGSYSFRIEVTDNRGGKRSDTALVVVSPQPPNILPTVEAGLSQSITLPISTITITATASDSDGTITNIIWTQSAGPSVATFAGQTTLTLTASNLIAGSYSFRVEVTDDRGGKRSDLALVVVSPEPPNLLPVVNAGTDRILTLPTNSSSFLASATDSDGTIASYLWSQVSGPNVATLTDVTRTNLTVSNLVAGTYIFNIKATDNRGGEGNDTISVLVNPAPAVVSFAVINNEIFVPLCVSCHGSVSPQGGYSMSNYNAIKTRVVNNNANASELYQRVIDNSMPPGSPLSNINKNRIRDWINNGALNN